MEGQTGQGYSLHKTILAHGQELNPNSDGYSKLNVHQLSNVDEALRGERLRYILQKFPLDETQRKAFDRSVQQVVARIHLILGPLGTGKTHSVGHNSRLRVSWYPCAHCRGIKQRAG